MKKAILSLAVTFISVFCNLTLAQGSIGAVGKTSVVSPISISEQVVLDFGVITTTASSGGTVSVGLNGFLTADGGARVIGTAIGNAAAFEVSGDANATYSISLPADNVASLSSNGHTILLKSFISNPTSNGQLDSTGKQQIFVGATLQLNPNQPAGDYIGNYNVTVNYQ